MYDGAQVVGLYDLTSGALVRRYLFGPGLDEPLIWYEGTDTASPRYLDADERGSVVRVTNANGQSMRINTYDEFGRPGADNLGRFQYTGQLWLPEIGMYHYRARVYAPQIGRFVQPDPIGYRAGPNLYDYVGSDPVNATDPWGLLKEALRPPVAPNTTGPAVIERDVVVNGRRLPNQIGLVQQHGERYRGSRPNIEPGGGSGGSPQNNQHAATPGQETPDTEDENEKDIAICNSLRDAGARSRCFESANARDYARRWNRPLPPLITWRTAAPGVQPRAPNPWAVGGVLAVGGAVACAIAEPCGAAVVGALGLGGLGILATQ